MCLDHIESFMLRSGVQDILCIVQLCHLICYYCCYNILCHCLECMIRTCTLLVVQSLAISQQLQLHLRYCMDSIVVCTYNN